MDIELVFTIVNTAVLPFWLLLIVAPHAKVTDVLVHSGLVGVVYGVIYIGYLGATMLGDSPEGAGMGSLASLQAAFSDPRAMLAAWVHYLVFDLFVGAWITRDAKRHGIHHVLIFSPLVLTLMTGPFGLLLYLLLRAGMTRRFTLQEADEPGDQALSPQRAPQGAVT